MKTQEAREKAATLEEAAEMIISKADDGDSKTEKEDEYSEEVEKSLLKAKGEAEEAYNNYLSKKPKKEVEKSEESGLEKSEEEKHDTTPSPTLPLVREGSLK